MPEVSQLSQKNLEDISMFVVEKANTVAEFASCQNFSVIACNPSDYTSLALQNAYNTREIHKTNKKYKKKYFLSKIFQCFALYLEIFVF